MKEISHSSFPQPNQMHRQEKSSNLKRMRRVIIKSTPVETFGKNLNSHTKHVNQELKTCHSWHPGLDPRPGIHERVIPGTESVFPGLTRNPEECTIRNPARTLETGSSRSRIESGMIRDRYDTYTRILILLKIYVELRLIIKSSPPAEPVA